jgi:hypothetical protein
VKEKTICAPIIIVLAWIEEDPYVTDDWERYDGVNYRRRAETRPGGHAVIWLNEGTPEDRERAEAWRRSNLDESGRVFCYPASESDPLGRAKREVMK